VSTVDHTLAPKAGSTPRFEVITEPGTPFSEDDKAEIIEETFFRTFG
jgi:hypothetical protein